MTALEAYLLIITRTIIVYLLVLIIFRLMGKREVGELSILDIAVYVLIAEVASLSIDNLDRSFVLSIVPIIVLYAIQYLNAVVILKNKRLRDVVDGDPSIIIRNGLIVEDVMVKQRYNLDDLFQQLRENQVSSIQSVAYAFLEPSGKLSIFLKDAEPFILPLIVDGYVDKKHLKLLNRSEEWLEQELRKQHILNVKDIFYACYENDSLYVQLKSRATKG